MTQAEGNTQFCNFLSITQIHNPNLYMAAFVDIHVCECNLGDCYVVDFWVVYRNPDKKLGHNPKISTWESLGNSASYPSCFSHGMVFARATDINKGFCDATFRKPGVTVAELHAGMDMDIQLPLTQVKNCNKHIATILCLSDLPSTPRDKRMETIPNFGA